MALGERAWLSNELILQEAGWNNACSRGINRGQVPVLVGIR